MTTIIKFMELIELIKNNPGLTQSQIATIKGRKPYEIHRYLEDAIDKKWITNLRGKYYLGDFFNQNLMEV